MLQSKHSYYPIKSFCKWKIYNPTNTHLLQNDRQYVSFTDKLAVDDVVTIKFISDTKADNSYYEIP